MLTEYSDEWAGHSQLNPSDSAVLHLDSTLIGRLESAPRRSRRDGKRRGCGDRGMFSTLKTRGLSLTHNARGLVYVVVLLAMMVSGSTVRAQTAPQDSLTDPVIEEPLRPLYPGDAGGLDADTPTPCGSISPAMLAAGLLLLPGLGCMARASFVCDSRAFRFRRTV